eukprot:s52_g6.t1
MLHLQSSTFALLEGIQLPSSLQSLTFVDELNQSREGIQLPGSQFDFDLWLRFNQSLEGSRRVLKPEA